MLRSLEFLTLGKYAAASVVFSEAWSLGLKVGWRGGRVRGELSDLILHLLLGFGAGWKVTGVETKELEMEAAADAE